VPVIGPFFLAQGATALALAPGVIASDRPTVTLGGALLSLATLGGCAA
jgi:hypothetical protein